LDFLKKKIFLIFFFSKPSFLNPVYIIRDGEIELFIETPNKDKKISLRILKKGDFFGEISFFEGIPHNTSAKSLSFSSLFVINKDIFLSIIKENNDDYEQFCQIKDQISLYQGFGGILNQCFSCKKGNHTILNCPILSPFNPFTSENSRKIQFLSPAIFSRKRNKKILNSLKQFAKIGSSAKKFTHEISKFANDLSQ